MKKSVFILTVMLLSSASVLAQQGYQITVQDSVFSINFETSVNNVNFGEFLATGFSPNPVAGQLDSDSWEIIGLSDGDLNFGGTATTGDFARGETNLPVGIGGVYSFLITPSNNILGIQATTDDMTPGSITLRIQNKTGSPINTLYLNYLAYTFNDEPTSGHFGFSHSNDNSTFTEILHGSIITEGPASVSPVWEIHNKNFKIEGLSIPANGYHYLRWTIKNTGAGSLDQFGIDDIGITANPASTYFVYNETGDGDPSNNWVPHNPNLTSIPSDANIWIENGTTSLTKHFNINKLTVFPGATLELEKSLVATQGVVNNGHMIFTSSNNTCGQLGDMTGATYSGSGEVTIQRFIPVRDDGKGAYRFLTSAVNSSGTINDDWQEGASSMGNPNPGHGMFITGSDTGSNGFDSTPAGAPSMFTFDNALQNYVAVPNTDIEQLTAGKAYAAYVWGDRSLDILSSNDPVATPTTLQASGSLLTGDQIISDLSSVAGNFSLVGNPYQAIVNMPDVMTLSTGINKNFYYVWDPNLGTRGAYTTVSLMDGINSTFGVSEANQHLMPGQAAWVLTTAPAASLKFTENTKAPLAATTDVFRNESVNASSIALHLFQADRFANGNSLSDAMIINFSEGGNNAVLSNDAPKMFNFDETISLSNNGELISIANRALPVDEETLTLYADQYRVSNYVFRAMVTDLPEGTIAYLKDNYLNITTELTNNETTLIDFDVDMNLPASIATDRFSLVFEKNALATDTFVGNEISIYPNPVKNGEFFIAVPGDLSGEKIQVELYNILGQKVYSENFTGIENGRIHVSTNSLETGIYVVKMQHDQERINKKIIIE